MRKDDPKRERSIGAERFDPDAVLAAIADGRRRAVLRSLRRDDGDAADLDALVDEVYSDARRDGAVTDAERRRIRTGLHHVDLPKLEAAGLVEYDPDEKRVRSVEGTFARQLRSAVDEHAAETRNG
ncbi:DUF7344 domain-containing protein [Halorubrum depositum]|uniref:DUF7344 domain-containing protein n=1 Tax=Halorubrum depositum TaxID=2583992 RepID=UPI0011A5320D|nr:hypothetical protein [Halorubrum depositum]